MNKLLTQWTAGPPKYAGPVAIATFATIVNSALAFLTHVHDVAQLDLL